MSKGTPQPTRVAVIGLGIAGLTATKNFIEAGLHTTAFERNSYIGGIWKYNPQANQHSVLQTTRPNGSKHFMAFSDFPLPDDAPTYPSASDIDKWLNDYAIHFDLVPSFRFGTTVQTIELKNEGIELTLEGPDSRTTHEAFDRVLVTTGPFRLPRWPEIGGLDLAVPKSIHSSSYKTPEPFRGKRVVVIGTGNTACDICTDLCGIAETVYVSMRSGNRIFKFSEPPIDKIFTRRFFMNVGAAELTPTEEHVRVATSEAFDRAFEEAWPEYDLRRLGLLPAPSAVHSSPGLNQEFIPRLASGQITSIGTINKVETGKVVTEDGCEVECDSIICATGGVFDYSILSPSIDPSNWETVEWDTSPNAQGLRIPRLYQGLFPPQHADRLAFIGPFEPYSLANPSNFDLMGAAIAQIWSGNFDLPSSREMEEWCDRCYQYQLELAKEHKLPRPRLWKYQLERWLNEAAGNGVNEAFERDGVASDFKRTDPELWELCLDGTPNPYVHRLLEGRSGGRKRWKSARDAILWANGKGPAPVLTKRQL